MSPDEHRIIDIFQRRFGAKSRNDIESFRAQGGTMASAIDTMVQSTDMPAGMSLKDAARKSVVSCVSDFAAKGVRPRYGLVSVVLPKGITESDVKGLAAGFAQAGREFGIKMLGGDTNQGREIAMSIVLFGRAPGRIVGRGSARAGDLVFATGTFGYTASGMRILGGAKAQDAFRRRALRSIMRPQPRLEFGVRAAGIFSASMDSSDGLGACLHQMARCSGKKIVITEIPSDDGVAGFARDSGASLRDLVFYGGEEFELVFTAPKSSAGGLARHAEACRIGLTQIGHVESGSGVFAQTADISGRLPDAGWRHLG